MFEPKTERQAQTFANLLRDRKRKYLDEIDEINVELRVLKSEWGVTPKKRRRHE
jgi:hypothetical protein